MGINEVTRKTIDEIEDKGMKEGTKKVEAIFFISGRFLTMQDLIAFSDLNPLILKEIIEKLKEKYSKEDSAFEIIEKNNMWKMDVKPEYSYIINKIATGNSEFSKAEQGTLAIIEYKQPIKQSVVVKISVNKAYDHNDKFSGLGLITKKKQGHTSLLSLSDEFYDYFNVSYEDDLLQEDLKEKKEE